jgi:hypothetical protein
MQDFLPPQVIFDGAGVLSATFTAATTDIITSNSHGYTGGERIRVSSGTTLPAGLSANTDYYVLKDTVTTNTFKVSATPDGTPVNITSTGTGTHTMTLKGRVILTHGYRHIMLAMDSSGTSTLTAKVQGSDAETMPDFEAAQSPTNQWDYLQVKDLEDGGAIDGDTGLALSGADDNRQFEVNTNGKRWVTVDITAWTQGKLRVTLSLSNG